MALVQNEMLQDPAILMTSKNPSLSAPKWLPRPRHSAGADLIANLLSPTEQTKNSTQTGRSNKSAKRTPKKRKPKTSPSKQSQSLTEQVAQLTLDTPTSFQVDQENRSPAKKPRRDTRTFRPSNKNSSPKTPKQVTKGNTSRPLGTNTNLVQSVPQHLAQPKQANTNTPFKRFPVSSNGFQQNRFVSSELNPHARSFIPRGFSKPGISNEYVSREIFEYYQRNRQTNDRFKSKQILRQSLENTFKQAFPHHVINLHLVGSSTNGIGDNSSSADICIIANKRSAPAVVSVPNNPEPVSTTSVGANVLEANNLQNLAESTSEAVSSEIHINTEAVAEELKEIENKLEPAQEVSEELNLELSEEEKEKKAVVELEASTEADAVAIEEKSDNVSEDAGNIKEKENAPNEAEKVETVLDEQPVNSEIADLTLDLIEKVLQSKNFAKNIVTIPAKVPIIKFKDDISKLDITLNLNQDVSIRNTQLIRDYAKMDWRFPYLAMILKQWARENRINSAIDKTISNYSWTLMVIHFLQVSDPPVLPSLQKLVPRRYDQHDNIEQAVNNWRRYPAKWRSNNNSNLRQLLKSMFRYYGYVFSYDQHVISIREGKALERTAVYSPNPDDHHNQWNSFLCIEEPFTRSNTTRSVHDKDKFDRIIELFRMSSNALRGLRISLFNVIADDLDFPITY